MKRLFVGTVPPKSEEVIGSEEVICRNSHTKKILKRLSVGTVPTKKVKRYQIVSNSIIVSKVSKYQSIKKVSKSVQQYQSIKLY